MPETIPSGVPVISPEGSPGFLPQENLQTALGRGFKMASFVTSPEGQTGLLPLDRVHEAIQNRGFKLGPASQQDTAIEHPERPQNAMEYIGEGIKQGAYAIPNMYEGAIKGAQDIVAGKNQHNLTSGMAGIGRLAQTFNPLPPDQGQGIVNRVAQGAGVVAGAAMTGLPEAEGVTKAVGDVAKDTVLNPAKEAFNRAKVLDAEKALDAALPAKAGVNTASEFATPDVIQRIRDTAKANGITEPSAANLKKAVDQVVIENRVEFHKYLDPVADVPATVPLMPAPVLRKLVANVELNNPDVAARMKSGQTTLGDLDVIRQRINQDTKYPATNSSETAMNSALKDAAGKIRDRLYPQLESLNNLPPDTLRDLKAEEGTFTRLQPLTDKYDAAISKYGSKEATKGMLEKFSGGARGTMGGSIGSAVGGTVGMAVGGPPGAAVGGSVGAVAGRLLAGREGKVAESQRLMRAVFGQQ